MPPAPADLVIRGSRVLLESGIAPAAIAIRAGRIEAIETARPDLLRAPRTLDAADAVVMPGLVDTHVHINDPGRADWEGFETATAAAAAGGITTLVDMPLNSVPATTTSAAFIEKTRAAHNTCAVDVALWAGVVPGNASELAALARHGAPGFKCFLAPSGVDEFHHVSESDLRAAAPHLAALDLPLLVHAESPRILERSAHHCPPGERRYSAWLASRPREAEHDAIDLILRLCEDTGLRAHIVHLSSADALPRLAAAKARGVRITVETCPHYLTFAAEDIPDGATLFKCAPPIRKRANREQLWQGLRSGVIDLIATDHSPSPPALKHLESGDFARAWGGIASLELSLPATWTAAHARGFSIHDLARWMCRNTAQLAGLARRKGAIAPGYDADLVIWRPEAEFTVRSASLLHRHKPTPYDGLRLRGVVERTFLRGVEIFADGAARSPRSGRVITPLRETAP